MGQEVGGLQYMCWETGGHPSPIWSNFFQTQLLCLRVLGHGPSRYTMTNGNYLLVSYTLSMWRESCEGLYCQESRSNTRLYPLYSSYPETSSWKSSECVLPTPKRFNCCPSQECIQLPCLVFQEFCETVPLPTTWMFMQSGLNHWPNHLKQNGPWQQELTAQAPPE